jgi:hypothetical protein
LVFDCLKTTVAKKGDVYFGWEILVQSTNICTKKNPGRAEKLRGERGLVSFILQIQLGTPTGGTLCRDSITEHE